MEYQHSERFTFGGVLLGFIAGVMGGAVVAYAYGAGLSLIPEVHLAAFATIAFGALVGVATGFGLVRGYVRNKQVTLGVAAVTSMLALYVSWAVWIAAIYQRTEGRQISWIKLSRHPYAVWQLMKWINQFGTWTFDNSKTATTGWQLWVVWGLEAALVIATAMFVAVAVVRQHPFCETCDQWCRRTVRFFLAPVQDFRPLKSRLESKDVQSLAAVGPGPKYGDHIIVDLESCETCQQFHTLTVTQVLTQRRKLGHPQVNSQKIVRQMLIGPSEAQTVRQLAEQIALAPKPSTAKARGNAAGK